MGSSNHTLPVGYCNCNEEITDPRTTPACEQQRATATAGRVTTGS